MADAGPHVVPVEAIVAASMDTVRRELADLTEAADFSVSALAADTYVLDGLLRRSTTAWVVTGGSTADARPFMRTARAARAATVAVLADRGEPGDWTLLRDGGMAILGESVNGAQFRAAVAASRAGLAVWEPAASREPDVARRGPPPLSPRERQVLELAGSGMSTKALARRLGISPNTVKFHLQSAFEKLGAASRAEAVMAAIRRGELAV
jgi:DNA-binding NarL/FixJ family response regulator